jgi:serine/threonine protein phosphatase PrpC
MHVRIETAGLTDIGKRRRGNEDQFLIAELNKSLLVESSSLQLDRHARVHGMSHGRLLLVADGMGGHQAGGQASLLAVDLLINQLVNGFHWPLQLDVAERDNFVQALQRMVQKTHSLILQASASDGRLRGMGTTLTLAYILWPMMYVAHAGDSRCYLIRDGQARQLTRDHTVTSQLVEQGMSEEQADQSGWGHVLYNALGAEGIELLVEVHCVQLQYGDCVVLCSDGLTRYVKADELSGLLQMELELHEACRSLVELANFRGGVDNITVVCARCVPPHPDDRPRTTVSTQLPLEHVLGASHPAGSMADTAEFPALSLLTETVDSLETAPSDAGGNAAEGDGPPSC